VARSAGQPVGKARCVGKVRYVGKAQSVGKARSVGKAQYVGEKRWWKSGVDGGQQKREGQHLRVGEWICEEAVERRSSLRQHRAKREEGPQPKQR